MAERAGGTGTPMTIQALRQEVAPYIQPNTRTAVWQLLNTFIPYVALWVLMCVMLRRGCPYWQVLAPLVAASLLLVRLFIFFHDCTHGSFFASRRANRAVGILIGVLTFTPYEGWRLPHNVHHSTYADLDHRGVGDVWTLTIEEYRASSWLRRLSYRLYRSPALMAVFGSAFLFLIEHRFPDKGDRKPERDSVTVTNLAAVTLLALASLTIGLRAYLLIQMPIMLIAGSVGVWLFYVQHQFEGVYWMRHDEWDPVRAALEGSSYYRLPKILQWLTASIGLHYVHHIQPRIPNYCLQRCLDGTPILQTVRPLTLGRSFGSLRLNLWDEQQHRLVSFRSLRRTPTRAQPSAAGGAFLRDSGSRAF